MTTFTGFCFICTLLVSLTFASRTETSLTTLHASVSSSISPTTKEEFIAIYHMDVEMGKSIDLTCGNFTNKDILHVIWEIEPYVGNSCRLAKSKKDPPEDSCKDRRQVKSKIGRNNTEEQFYLHIPELEFKYEGIYKCEVVYNGGAWKEHLYLNATVSPSIYTNVERLSDGTVKLVCQASNGKPAANISWTTGDDSTQKNSADFNGTISVKSWIIIPANASLEDIFCKVEHKTWNRTQSRNFTVPEHKGPDSWIFWIAIPGVILLICLIIATSFYFIRKHLSHFRNCTKATMPAPTPPAVAIPSKITEVDELEPYASYVERVNSIYNSSAELCNV
ncbi:cell surface glycoprotein CD200 receptor 1-A isoform X1 [Erpetoichthys calabaricus]|uniref:Ig-like domain-containing protein n=1 Tax=Erpetoichthys calabaricus TaxID=27687 RepID=A0A8C4SII7_ERPCA|nr:cell surface glycoprotein CD200 receptor 1-A isoform X1 [Erpetoichthys calabaricus]